jgi:hypothetical protein
LLTGAKDGLSASEKGDHSQIKPRQSLATGAGPEDRAGTPNAFVKHAPNEESSMRKESRDIRRGFLMAGDWVFVATLLVLGAITGLVAVRSASLTVSGDARPVTVDARPVASPGE